MVAAATRYWRMKEVQWALSTESFAELCDKGAHFVAGSLQKARDVRQEEQRSQQFLLRVADYQSFGKLERGRVLRDALDYADFGSKRDKLDTSSLVSAMTSIASERHAAEIYATAALEVFDISTSEDLLGLQQAVDERLQRSAIATSGLLRITMFGGIIDVASDLVVTDSSGGVVEMNRNAAVGLASANSSPDQELEIQLSGVAWRCESAKIAKFVEAGSGR